MMLLITLCGIFLVSACSGPRVNLFEHTPNPLQEYTLEGSAKNKILLISINGLISDAPKKDMLTSSPSVVEQVVAQLHKAQKDKQIKAVLLKINSSGGTITASDLLYHEIAQYKLYSGNKIIVSMMDLAASGGYYVALPADLIMAHPTTITGSVGVIFIQPKVHQLMEKVGLGVDIKKFGKNKDMGSPFRESNVEERFLMQKTVNTFGERFISLVQKHRRLDTAALAEVSTARVFLADEALQMKLIDKIGYLNDAILETKKLAGLPDDARLVVYRYTETPNDNYYNSADASAARLPVSLVHIELPEILQAKAGFYYLWPGALGAE